MLQRNLVFCFLISLLGCSANEKQSLQFQFLPASKTGIDFENTITENDSVNLFDYYYIYNGSGVAVGDINNDGLPDLFFGGNMVTSRMYLNTAALTFQDITLEAGLETDSWVMGVTMVDINADQLLDIYLNIAGPSAQRMDNLLFINRGPDHNGIPVFEEAAAEYGINDPSFSIQSAFFDYDRDGDLDLFVLTNCVDKVDKTLVVENGKAITNGTTIDHLYENIGYIDSLGHPLYVKRDTTSGISHEGYGLGLGIDDLNQDGWPDIYVANDFMPDEKIYINQGNGKFEERAKDFLPTQSYNGMGVDIADVNHDLRPDIVVVDMLPDNNDRRKSMIGAMKPQAFHLRKKEGYQAQYVRNTLQLNRGNDPSGQLHFSEVSQLAGVHATDWSWAPLLADFDNDGDRDLFITNGFVKDMTDLDYVNFRASKSYFGTKEAKVEREKRLMEALTEVKIPNFLYQNQGNLTFTDVTKAAGINTPSFSNGAIYADLDADGDLDIVTNEINAPALVYENTSREDNAYIKIKLKGSGLNTQAIGARIVAKTDSSKFYQYVSPTRGYLSSMQGEVHLGLGKDTILQSLTVLWPDGKQQELTAVQLNQSIEISYSPGREEQQIDEVVATPFFEPTSTLIDYTHNENTYSDFDRDPLLLQMYSRSGPCISVGDIDDKKGKDLYIGGSHGIAPTLFFQDQNGDFQKTVFPAGEEKYEDVASLLFDFDQDQDEDLYVVSGGSEFEQGSSNYQDRLYINDGKGNFSKSNALPEINASGSCVQGADFDQDGDIDLFVGGRYLPGAYPLSPRSYLLRNDGDKYEDITSTVAGLPKVGMVTSALWSDFDHDGWVDLILVGEWMPLTVFRNVEGILQKMENVSPDSEGWWNVIQAGDFDHDGDIDYVAGNLGHNQDYKASKDQPFVLYADDFDQNGKIDPIFAGYMKNHANGDTQLFPFHGKDDLARQITAYKRVFPSYQQYSEATITEVLSEEIIDKAQTFKAHTFSTSLFINTGKGVFQQVELPVEAQVAPVHAILVEDINQDGNLDLVIAGNHNSSENTYGAQNAFLGTCLLGTGKNTFNILTPAESGLYLNKSVRALSAFEVNSGENILVVAINAGALVTLKRSSKPIPPIE